MLEFILLHIKPFINSIGLIFDIIGAGFVASDVVKQFHGNKIVDDGAQCGAIGAMESDDYSRYEKNKYKKMRIGLYLLIFGFLLQILSNWL